MFCKAYERKLKDAAAGGEELSGESLQHVSECDECSAEWNQEQALFAAIDFSLQEAVNAEVPASLVAGVRQRVAAAEPKANWWKPVLAFAAMAVVVGGVAVRIALHKPNANGSRNEVAEMTPPTPASEETSTAASDSATETVPQHLVRQVRRERNEAAENREPEATRILISPVEAAGLDYYVKRLRSVSAEVVAKEVVNDDGPIGFQTMELAEIDLGVMTNNPLDGAK